MDTNEKIDKLVEAHKLITEAAALISQVNANGSEHESASWDLRNVRDGELHDWIMALQTEQDEYNLPNYPHAYLSTSDRKQLESYIWRHPLSRGIKEYRDITGAGLKTAVRAVTQISEALRS